MTYTTMADAWGDMAATVAPDPAVAMKDTTFRTKGSAAPVPRSMPVVTEPPAEDVPRAVAVQQEDLDLDRVIAQIEMLRLEQSKRSTTYVVIACILFSVLLWYVDRLNHRIGYLMMIQWKQSQSKP